MIEKGKREGIGESSWKGLSRFEETLVSAPLSAKLCFLVLIALFPRVLAFLQPQIITLDGTLYVKMAKLFAEGKYSGTPGSYFSLYPLLIFLIQRFIGDWELSGQMISMVLGTIAVIPVFLLGRSLYNEKIGWLAAIFYITLPNLLKFDTQVIRDPTLWFFILFTMWLVWEGEKKNRLLFFALASVSAGLGAITRVEGFIVWVTLVFYVGLKKINEISIKRKALNLFIFIFLFPLLVSIALFSLKNNSNEMAFGEMTSFAGNFIKAHTLTILHPQDPIDAIGEKTYDSLPSISQASLELASRHRWVLAISEVIHKFIKSANLLIILILFGFWKRRKVRFISSDWYLIFIFGAFFLMSIFYARQLYYFSTRHGLTLVLPCLFFAGHGLDLIVEILSQGLNRVTLGWIFFKRYLSHIVMAVLVILFLIHGISFKKTDKFLQKEIGLWLKAKGYQGSVMMGPRKFLRLAFYSDGTFIELPGTWEKALESIRQNEVNIILIDPSTIKQDCPDFSPNRSEVKLLFLERPKGEGEKHKMEIYSVF
jgi:4-amino-4-deoxy-L-arabinose transferase-like glycosyltransferase